VTERLEVRGNSKDSRDEPFGVDDHDRRRSRTDLRSPCPPGGIDVAHLVVDEVLAREPGTDTIGGDIVPSFSGKSPWPA